MSEKRIKYLSPTEAENTFIIRPQLKFESEGGYDDCTLYLDHVAVAYFDTRNGALNLLPLEVFPDDANDERHDVKYLQDRGVELEKKPHHWGKEGYWEYFLKIGAQN